MTRLCLIGESDPFIARLLSRFAEESGFETAQANQGEDLVKLARECQPRVIILDLELPGSLRGWEAFLALKVDPDCAHIPVITCCWLSEAAARDLVGDSVAHLQKPELYYRDFLAVLQQAGIGIEERFSHPHRPERNEL
jgi:CheY-like chemotaxis protein